MEDEFVNHVNSLLNLVDRVQVLHQELICSRADLDVFETYLFKFCVLSFNKAVVFIKEKEYILDHIDDNDYCDGVYSVVSEDAITFYEENGTPLLYIKIQSLKMVDDIVE